MVRSLLTKVNAPGFRLTDSVAVLTQRGEPDEELWDVTFSADDTAAIIEEPVVLLEIHVGAPYNFVRHVKLSVGISGFAVSP